jgi:hypothetical protein
MTEDDDPFIWGSAVGSSGGVVELLSGSTTSGMTLLSGAALEVAKRAGWKSSLPEASKAAALSYAVLCREKVPNQPISLRTASW